MLLPNHPQEGMLRTNKTETVQHMTLTAILFVLFSCNFLTSCEYIEAEKRMVVTRRYAETEEVGRHRSKVANFQYVGEAYRANAFCHNQT